MSRNGPQAIPHWFTEPPPTFLERLSTYADPQLCLFLGVAVLYLVLRFYGHLIWHGVVAFFRWLNSPRPVYIVDQKTGYPLEVAQQEVVEPAAEEGARRGAPPPPPPNYRAQQQ